MARTDEDIEQFIHNINWNAGSWQQYIQDHDTFELDRDIENAILDQLITNFAQAMDQIEEYQEGPLREHLLDMLINNVHARVSQGRIISIFDADNAGSYEDVVAGQVAAGANFSIPPHKRSAGWRILYDIANHGMEIPKWAKDRYDEKTYDEVIQARIGYWGEKAPYWIFVEFGTAGAGGGPGTPYPSFSGKGPVYRTQQQAIRIAEMFTEAWYETIDDTLEYQIEDEEFIDDRIGPGGIADRVEIAWTKSFPRGKNIVQLEQERGKFTGRYKIVGRR